VSDELDPIPDFHSHDRKSDRYKIKRYLLEGFNNARKLDLFNTTHSVPKLW